MNILVVGSGGREHALVWKIRQSSMVQEIFCAPGNAGIAELADCVPIPPTDMESLARFAASKAVDLTVIGPEQPLTQGIVDRFERDGLRAFGPSKAAAQLEGSKVFAKRFMEKYNIPTAAFGAFGKAQEKEAIKFIEECVPPIVIKADGLAAGKGVVICERQRDAVQTLESVLKKGAFGPAGDQVVIEEFLEGEEISVFALTDGTDYVVLPTAQDHKRILEGDRGKNTGGMGAYAPAPAGSAPTIRRIEQTVIKPTIDGMAEEARPYRGCLYIGLMLTAAGPKVLEYNCRFGDPETQVVLPLIDGDLVELLDACVSGEIRHVSVRLKQASAVCVVIASAGYPDEYKTGCSITGLQTRFEEDIVIFHAGTRREQEVIQTSGGRVLGVTAIGTGSDLPATIDKAYRAVKNISFAGAYFRTDIGKKGVERMTRLRIQEAH